MEASNNAQNEKLTAYLRKIKRGPGIKANAAGGRGAKDASNDVDSILGALKQNWTTLQSRIQELPDDEQGNLRELLNNNVEGLDNFGDWLFDSPADEFERYTMDWNDASRESVRELLMSA